MFWFWILLSAIALAAGVRYVRRLRAASAPPRVDDETVRRILEEGRLSTGGDADEPLDLDEAARAEEEFWAESWDEPEEHSR